MNLDQRREHIRLSFRREHVIAALVAHQAETAAPVAIGQPKLPQLQPVGFMSAKASKALFGY